MADPLQEYLEWKAKQGRGGTTAPSVTAPSQVQAPVAQAAPAAAKKAYGFSGLFSGAETIDALTGTDIGSRTRAGISKAPIIGAPLAAGLDSALSPFGLATAAFGGPVAAAVGKSAIPGAKIAAGFVAPLVKGGFGTNVAAGVSVGAAGKVGGEVAKAIAPDALDPYAEVAGSVLGAGANLAAIGKRLPAAAATVTPKLEGIGAESVDKLTNLLRQAKPMRAAVKKLQTAELGRRAGGYARAFDEGGTTMKSALSARSELAGKLPSAAFEAPATMGFSETDVNQLVARASDHFGITRGDNSRILRFQDLMGALNDAIVNGKLPTRGEIRELSQVYGKDFADALLSHRSTGEKVVTNILDMANVPRAVLSSWDISAPFRQGLGVSNHKEFWGALAPMVKSFGSAKYAAERQAILQQDPWAARFSGNGGYIGEMGYGPALGNAEEAFGSRLANRIPLVARSERAYVQFLNEVRVGVYKHAVGTWERLGLKPSAGDEQALATWLNVATGRGRLPSHELVDAANVFMFSPRMLSSVAERMGRALVEPVGALADVVTGAQAYGSGALLPGSVLARREAAKDLVSVYGTIAAGLSLLKLSGAADVELDPRSSDFGRVRIGKTRYDPWGGMQPLARFIAQEYSGQRKNSAGEIVEADRKETAGRFAETKASPLAGMLVDFARGKTIMGEEMDITTPSGAGEQVFNRMAPLFAQDLIQAIRTEGALGALKTAPGVIGLGVQTYETVADVQNRLALASPAGVPWDQLTSGQQQRLEEEHPEEFDKVRVQSDYRVQKEALEEGIRGGERAVAEAAQSLDPSKRLTVDQMRTKLTDLNAERILKMQQARKDFGVDVGDGTDVVSRFYALRDQASVAGVTDPMELDALQEDFYNHLTAAEKAKVDDLRTFRHDPAVKSFYDAKKVITDSGYWKAQSEAFDQWKHLLPDEVKTMTDAIAAYELAVQQGNRGEAARLQKVIGIIRKVTERDRLLLRREDANLDKALNLIYGSKLLPGNA